MRGVAGPSLTPSAAHSSLEELLKSGVKNLSTLYMTIGHISTVIL